MRAALALWAACGASAPAAPASDETSAAELRWVAPPALGADFPGPTNSDGSQRNYPPPPGDVAGRFLTLNYAAFGPQAMAHELIGMEPYAFAAGACCYQPGDRFDVRVVVHGEGQADAAAQRYPTSAATGDYRLVEVGAALAYVERHLTDLRSWPAGERMRSLEAELERLGATLRSFFGVR
jgi:hypothetical protein